MDSPIKMGPISSLINSSFTHPCLVRSHPLRSIDFFRSLPVVFSANLFQRFPFPSDRTEVSIRSNGTERFSIHMKGLSMTSLKWNVARHGRNSYSERSLPKKTSLLASSLCRCGIRGLLSTATRTCYNTRAWIFWPLIAMWIFWPLIAISQKGK